MIWSVPLIDTAATRAPLARIVRTDCNQRYAASSRLVSDKGAELVERPGMQAGSLAALGLNPTAYALQLFQGNATSGAFGSRYDRLRDAVVGVFAEPGLLPGNLLQPALSGLGAAALQAGFSTGELGSDALYIGAGIDVPIAIGSEIDDAEIDAEPVFGIEFFGFWHVAGGGEIPLSAHETEIDLALAVDQQSPLMLTHYDQDGDAAFDSPKVDSGAVLNEADKPIIIGLRCIAAEDRYDFAIDLEGVSHFGDGAHCRLCGQTELSAEICVSELVQIKLAKCAGLVTSDSKPCRRLVAAS